MAIDTINLTKISVAEQIPNLFIITIRLVCEDTSVEVIDQEVAERYRPGDSIPEIVAKIKTKMQGIIDEYVGEQALFDQPALDTQITSIESDLRTANIP
jgi:hypothetical protein